MCLMQKSGKLSAARRMPSYSCTEPCKSSIYWTMANGRSKSPGFFAFHSPLNNRKLNTTAALFWLAAQMNRCSGTEKQKETLMKKFILLIGMLGLLLAMVGEGVAATIPQGTRTRTV